jgi:hypothetical protein
MNLDAFWIQAKSTALSNGDKVAFGLKMLKLVGLLGSSEADGPLLESDHCGYEVAVEMLLHTQFNTIRKLQSTFSHC